MKGRALVALLLVAALGCAGGGTCLLVINLPDEQARQLVKQLEVWVVDAASGECSQFVSGELEPATLESLAHMVYQYPPASPLEPLEDVPVGNRMFLVEGRGEAGQVFLRGCQVASVGSKGSVTVEVAMEWVCRPEPEQCNDGKDNDCDGQTDEGCIVCEQDSDCDDGNPCTIDFCVSGECHQADFPDHTPCNDGDACTLGDECLQGSCTGRQRDCSALDAPCVVGKCDEETGECMAEPREDGTVCDDGLFCTTGDSCTGGVCSGHPRDCSDGDECTQDTCSEAEAECVHTLVPRPGDEGPAESPTCTNGIDDDCDGLTDGEDPNCSGCTSDADCDDGNPCTADSCEGLECSNRPVADGTACDDGLFCTVGDSCTGGVCAGSPRDCSAGAGPCQEGICAEDLDSCQFRDKVDDSPCDDGLFCTVGDRCRQGRCEGSARDCDDGDECTSDSCDEGSFSCLHELVPRPGAEGLAVADSCSNLLDDDCDGLTDADDPDCRECSADADCDDGNPCTADSCQAGSCVSTAEPDGTACDDGRFCTEPDSCQQGTCTGPARDCSFVQDQCNGSVCNEQLDTCEAVPLPDGTSCDDGLFCTEPDTCRSGSCEGQARDCDDGDPCTADSCDELAKACQHTLVPNPGAEGPPGHGSCSTGIDEDCDGLTDMDDPDCYDCLQDGDCDDGNFCTADSCVQGLCSHQAVQDGTPCDDGLFCTDPDTCQGGFCTGPPRDCSALADSCHDASCDEAADICRRTERPDGTPCDDGLFCTVQDNCQAGICTGTARDCSSVADICNDGVCDEASSSCQKIPKQDGTPCSDGLFCTDPDSCQGGVCTGNARDCSDGDDCTLDTCSESEGRCLHELNPQGTEGEPGQPPCMDGTDNDCDGLTDLNDPDCHSCFADTDCDDGEPCTADTCSMGLCSNLPVADGTACDDGLWCTVGDSCSGGVCSGTPRDCSAAGDECHSGVCDEGTQSCQPQQLPDGTPCSDGLWCTLSEQCLSGVCTEIAARDCSDEDACTVDSCDEGSQSCRHDTVPKPEALDYCGDGIDQDCDGMTDGCCQSDGTYGDAGSTAVGPGPWYMTSSDLNHDGRADMVTVNRGDDTVTVLLSNGDGTFLASNYSCGDNPYGVAIGDLDSDGWPDIVTANNGGNSLTVLWGQGGGTFGERQDLSLAPRSASPLQVVVGDFNADAIPDLASANWNDDSVAVLLGQGTDGRSNRTFSAPAFYGVGGTGLRPRAIVSGDFNSDGIADLAVANWNGGKISVLLGQGSGGRGDGTFGAPARFDAGSGQVNISTADFNSDAIADLAVVAMYDNAVNILLGQGNDGRGDGTFASRVAYPTGSTPVSAWPADLDGDGITDLVVAEYGTGGVSVFTGTGGSGVGDGGFSARRFFATAAQPTAAVALLADDDSIPDLASCNYGPDNVVVLRGGGSGGVPDGVFVQASALQAGCDAPAAILEKDLDHDAISDLVIGCTTNPNIVVLKGQGVDGRANGTFAPVWSTNSGQSIVALAIADIDSDSIPDLAVADASGSIRTFLQNGASGRGDGTFSAGSTIDVSGTPLAVSLIDVNRDAIRDLLWLESPGGLGVRLGNGTDGVADGTFGAAAVYPAGGDPTALATGDVDLDGIPDAVVANGSADTVTVMLGQGANGRGNGAFASSETVAVADRPVDVVLRDVDNDGMLDLVVACREAGSISVRLGAGGGSFAGGGDYPVSGAPVHISVTRLDTDPWPDVVVVSEGSNEVGVLPGTGGGSFGTVTTLSAGGQPAGLSLAHFDWDGKLDLAVAGSAGELWLFRGTGSCSAP